MPPMTVEMDGTISMETSLNASLNMEGGNRVLKTNSSFDSVDAQSSSSSSSVSSFSSASGHNQASSPPPQTFPGTPPIRCPHCPFITTQNYKLVRHTKAVHTKEKPYKCAHCDLSFLEKCVLVRHVRVVHEKHRDYVCEQCDKTFASNANLKQHLDAVHEKLRPFKCSYCEADFGSKGVLYNHVQNKHLETRFECEICHKTLKSRKSLHAHVTTVHHKDKLVYCEYCDKGFATSNSLQRHIDVVHEQIKPLRCNVCNFRTATNWQLIVHKKTHSEEKIKLRCDECGEEFNFLTDVVEHKKEAHGGGGGGGGSESGTGSGSGSTDDLVWRTEANTRSTMKAFEKRISENPRMEGLALINGLYVPGDPSTSDGSRHLALSPLPAEVQNGSQQSISNMFMPGNKDANQQDIAMDSSGTANGAKGDGGGVTCLICGNSSSRNKKELRIHIDEIHKKGQPQICKLCGMVLRNKHDLTRHAKNVHNVVISTVSPVKQQLMVPMVNASNGTMQHAEAVARPSNVNGVKPSDDNVFVSPLPPRQKATYENGTDNRKPPTIQLDADIEDEEMMEEEMEVMGEVTGRVVDEDTVDREVGEYMDSLSESSNEGEKFVQMKSLDPLEYDLSDTTTPSNTTDTIINPATTTIESNGLRKKSDSSDFETPKIEEINGNMQERNEDETHHLSYAQSPPPESRPPLPRPPPPPPSGQSLTSSGKKRGRPKGSKTRFRTLKADGTTIRIAVPTSEELKMSGENEGGSETENVSGGSIESDSGGNGSGGEERIDSGGGGAERDHGCGEDLSDFQECRVHIRKCDDLLPVWLEKASLLEWRMLTGNM